MNIRCISVDDEPLAREGIRIALSNYKDFELIAEFGDVDSTLSNLPTNLDVIFIDIEMPRQDGFSLLSQWPGALPLVVFVTAYDKYAIKAFENQALDYVLKPIDEQRFEKVIDRIRQQFHQRQISPSLKETEHLRKVINGLKQKLVAQEAEICVKTDEGYFQIKLAELLYLEAVGDHVCFHFNGKQLITRNTLKYYIAQLQEHNFYQVHKSFLVNAEHVKQVIKLRFGDHQLLMSDTTKLKLTRHYKSVIEHLI